MIQRTHLECHVKDDNCITFNSIQTMLNTEHLAQNKNKLSLDASEFYFVEVHV